MLDSQDVRLGKVMQGINEQNVARWLLSNIERVEAPFSYELIAGGHSNLTYSVTDAKGRRLVLRRPPLGHVLESAHDMGREHKIISALFGKGVPVAETFGLCIDTDVNEAPFYIMDFVDGPVLHDAAGRAARAQLRCDLGPGLLPQLSHRRLELLVLLRRAASCVQLSPCGGTAWGRGGRGGAGGSDGWGGCGGGALIGTCLIPVRTGDMG